MLAFGVSPRVIVDALRGAGLADADVTAVVGRAIAQSAGLSVPTEELTATPAFVFQTPIAQVAPDCVLTYQRLFRHADFIDGVTVVQGGATPEDVGFNRRFHLLEDELDNIAQNLRTASNCIAELRLEVYGMAQELQAKITDIDTRIDGKAKDKEKDTKEKEKDTKEKEKDTKEKEKEKDKEGKDTKEKEKDTKEKEKDTKEKEKDKEKEGQKDGSKEHEELAPAMPSGFVPPAQAGPADDPGAEEAGEERTFIRLEDRPEVGRVALAGPDAEPAAESTAELTPAEPTPADESKADQSKDETPGTGTS
jgi:hypothetical protein